jgi:hypothetical protein
MYSNRVAAPRLPDSVWRTFGERLEVAMESGNIPGKPHVSMFDKDQADQRKAIVEKAKEKWAVMPITYTDTDLSRFAMRLAHSARETQS